MTLARRAFTRAAVVAASLLCAGLPPVVQAQPQDDPAVAALGAGFASDTVAVNGTTLHYVRGGSGPAVILLHGFPQSWYEFHEVMPRLAQRFTVVAADLRGIGGSDPTVDGYDAANLAEDIRQLAQALNLERPYVVGHDIGGIVAYALARRHPDELRGVMTLDVPLPGIDPWDAVTADPLLWHINFHQTPDLPEQLIAGRQDIYFRHFFRFGTVDPAAISEAEMARYVAAHGTVEQLRAAFEMYRAFPANAAFNDSQRQPLELPLVMAGGAKSFGPLLPQLAESLKHYGWADITVEIIENGSHYLADERPGAVAALIERYASK